MIKLSPHIQCDFTVDTDHMDVITFYFPFDRPCRLTKKVSEEMFLFIPKPRDHQSVYQAVVRNISETDTFWCLYSFVSIHGVLEHMMYNYMRIGSWLNALDLFDQFLEDECISKEDYKKMIEIIKKEKICVQRR